MPQTPKVVQKSTPLTPNHVFPHQLPHKKLPAELWSEIFIFCLGGAPVKPRRTVEQPRARARQLPWILGHVCSEWRKIVLNEPRLWSCIEVPHGPLNSKGGFAADYYIKMTQSFFSMSKGALISFSTHSQSHYPVIEDNPLPSLIIPQAHRFYELQIQSASTWIYPILELPSGSFPKLEALKLWFYGPTLENPGQYEVFRSCTRLRRLHLAGAIKPNFINSSLISLPWHQLQHLTLGGVSLPFETVCVIFTRCMNLVECGLFFDYVPDPLPTTIPALPHLQSLSLAFETRIHWFLDLLILPSLRNLKFSSSQWRRWPEGPILRLIQRSSCLLNTLDSPLTIHENDVEALLKACPAIVELCIPSTIIEDSVVKRMICGDLVPSLEVINYLVRSMSLFLDLIEARTSESALKIGYNGIREATGHPSWMVSHNTELTLRKRYEELRKRLLKNKRTILYKMM